MYGQASNSGQWPPQGGYSRQSPSYKANYSSDQTWPAQQSQNYTNISGQTPWQNQHGQTSQSYTGNWQDTSIMPTRARNSSPGVSPGPGIIPDTFSGHATNVRNSWQDSTPMPLLNVNRKRPLPMETDDYMNNSRSDSWPQSDMNRPRSDAWSDNRNRSTSWNANNRNRSDGWSENRTRAGAWSERSKPSFWPRPNSCTTPINIPTGSGFSNFGRSNRPTGGNFPPKRRSQTVDISNLIQTTYTVDSKKINLPKELTSKFAPLKCDLCGVFVNSTVTAKTHYLGKIHERKVSQFMQKWFTEKGEPIPEQFKEGVSKKQASSESPLYCTTCQLPLTSKLHAEQHYMGKSHKRALQTGGSKKSGNLQTEKPDPSGRFKIGLSFVKMSDPLGLKTPKFESSMEVPQSINKNPFSCELCAVHTTSADQLEMHLSGARHKKKIKLSTNADSGDQQIIQSPLPPVATVVASAVKMPPKKVVPVSKADDKKDFSGFRTPSGQFYCAMCNVTMNSEMQFSQHNESKKHKLCVAKGKSADASPSNGNSTVVA